MKVFKFLRIQPKYGPLNNLMKYLCDALEIPAPLRLNGMRTLSGVIRFRPMTQMHIICSIYHRQFYMHVVNHVLRQCEFRSILNQSEKLDELVSDGQAEFQEISKFSFLRINLKNDNQHEFPDFNEVTLYLIFPIFLKMVMPIMTIFFKNFENQTQGEFVKILEFTLVIIFVIFAEK